MKRLFTHRSSGVTLTELLVVVTIVGILSTIAVPVYINQAQRARIGAAQQEVREIAHAMDQVGVVHGLYVPLQVLDDIPGAAGQGGNDSNSDAIADNTSLFAIDFNLPINQLSSTGQSLIIRNSPDRRVREMVINWGGPFLSPQRVYDIDSNPFNRNKEDFLLDPWGNPYLFYSPIGAIGTSNPIPPYSNSDFSGILSNSDDRFDRWAILSMGPDGQPDVQGSTAAQIPDDIYYVFGTVIGETTFGLDIEPNPTPTP